MELDFFITMFVKEKGVKMTKEEAFNVLKENICGMCAYTSKGMESCDICSCDNRDAIKTLEQDSKTLTEAELFKLIRGYYGINKEDLCFIIVSDVHNPGTPKYIATNWDGK